MTGRINDYNIGDDEVIIYDLFDEVAYMKKARIMVNNRFLRETNEEFDDLKNARIRTINVKKASIDDTKITWVNEWFNLQKKVLILERLLVSNFMEWGDCEDREKYKEKIREYEVEIDEILSTNMKEWKYKQSIDKVMEAQKYRDNMMECNIYEYELFNQFTEITEELNLWKENFELGYNTSKGILGFTHINGEQVFVK